MRCDLISIFYNLFSKFESLLNGPQRPEACDYVLAENYKGFIKDFGIYPTQ
jgi:hypothetical protein